jgi:GNAT superfamily N-acetyltransferase
MEKIIRADATNPDFLLLIKELNDFLNVIDGEEFDFYFQFNQLEAIKHTIILYIGDLPVACGAIKAYEPGTMEVKRMFTRPEFRGSGHALKVLHELEKWAEEMGYSRCILETGIRQSYAIALYQKAGYAVMPNYGQYKGVENSVCFEKSLTR